MRKTIQALIEAAMISYLPIAFIYADVNPHNWTIGGRAWCVGIFTFLMFLYGVKRLEDSRNETE
jgi:hypothetical protein